jgi:hypothetical protein
VWTNESRVVMARRPIKNGRGNGMRGSMKENRRTAHGRVVVYSVWAAAPAARSRDDTNETRARRMIVVLSDVGGVDGEWCE